MLDLAVKDFKAVLINMCKELKKKTMFKELKESVMTMIPQIENINEEMEIIKKKNQVEILESEMKNYSGNSIAELSQQT